MALLMPSKNLKSVAAVEKRRVQFPEVCFVSAAALLVTDIAVACAGAPSCAEYRRESCLPLGFGKADAFYSTSGSAADMSAYQSG